MADLWFAILVGMTITFVVLDGWTIGAGILHRVVATTDDERRQVVAALGPLWSWHEVWLVAAGGVALLAFPRLLAAVFSGFYLPLWFFVWSLVARGLALELRGHLDEHLWRRFFDGLLTASSVALALLVGVMAANVIRGVPLDATGYFSLPLFADFGVVPPVGVLDWFTIVAGVAAVLGLAAHGA